MSKLSKINEIMENMPTKLTRCYRLESRYFSIYPTIASATVRFELLYSYLQSEIDDSYLEIPDWNINELDNAFWEEGPASFSQQNLK
jgi:hypothetical protein